MREIVVFSAPDESIAIMAREFLIAEGLHPRYIEGIKNYYAFVGEDLGGITIRVPEDELERALEILAVRFSEVEGEAAEYEDDAEISDAE